MKKILIISMSDIKNDPRVDRQVRALSKDYEVMTMSYGESSVKGLKHYNIIDKKGDNLVTRAFLLKTHQYEKYYHMTFDIHDVLSDAEYFDLILANDNDSLPLAFDIADEDTRIIHDAHEYAPQQQSDDLKWRFFMQGFRMWACKTYLHRCDRVLTVCDGIADRYASEYNIPRPHVITNAADYWDLAPFNLLDGRISLIHHGISNPPRKIEKLIEMTKYLDNRFHLTLMLVDREPSYTAKLKEMAADYPKVAFRQPVPAKDIIPETNKYDIGIFIAEPSNDNLKYALPNKFFEYIQARLMIAIGPSPEMQRYTELYHLGIVSDDFTPVSMAKKLNALMPEDVWKYKQHVNHAAGILNSRENMEYLIDIVKDVLNDG